MATEKDKGKLASVTTKERNAFKPGDSVEYDGKLAKVVNYGFLEIPTNPGENQKFTDDLRANLQLPAETPGGKPEYAFNVPADEVKSLKDDPKRLRSLQQEYAPLMGDKPPADPAKEGPAPEIRQGGKSKARAATPKATKADDTPDVATAVKRGETATTSKSAAPKKASAKKSSGKTAK